MLVFKSTPTVERSKWPTRNGCGFTDFSYVCHSTMWILMPLKYTVLVSPSFGASSKNVFSLIFSSWFSSLEMNNLAYPSFTSLPSIAQMAVQVFAEHSYLRPLIIRAKYQCVWHDVAWHSIKIRSYAFVQAVSWTVEDDLNELKEFNNKTRLNLQINVIYIIFLFILYVWI